MTVLRLTHTLSLFELLKRTTDISTEDFRLRGMSMDFLAQNGFARVVSRSSFRIHRMPSCNERIEIITAEEKPEALQIVQGYEVKSAQGESLISGESTWMLIEPSSRRIIPAKNFTLRTPPTNDCLPNGRILRPESLTKLGEVTIQRSQMDGNGHTDNAWYASFIENALPKEYEGRLPKDFRINYSKELLLGETVELLASFSEDRRKVTVIGQKQEGEKPTVSFESELFY